MDKVPKQEECVN